MNKTILLIVMSAFVALTAISTWWLMLSIRRQTWVHARILMAQGMQPAIRKAPTSAEIRHAAVRLMSQVGNFVLRSGILPARTLSELEVTLTAAGLRGSQGIGVFLGAKIIALFCLPAMTLLLPADLPLPSAARQLAPLVAAVVGLMLPDRVIIGMRRRYIRRLEHGIPDTLDMMIICTQAGLGLGAAIVRVATEMRMAYPEVAAELEQTATEMQMLSDTRLAIAQLGTRTGLEALKRLSATLIQSLQYGTPMSDALRILSTELRQQSLNRFESRAARLPVMMTLPTIAFILPCVFLVTSGPAIIQLIQAFNHRV